MYIRIINLKDHKTVRDQLILTSLSTIFLSYPSNRLWCNFVKKTNVINQITSKMIKQRVNRLDGM